MINRQGRRRATHTEYAALMSLALDGEATADELQMLERHLAFCASCSATWMQWQALDARLKAAPVVSPARGLAGPVISRLEERQRWRLLKGWMGLGLLGIWLGTACVVGVIIAAATLWAASHPLHASVILSAGAHLLSSLVWPLRGAEGVLGGAGLSLWTGVGVLAAGTIGLLGLWVWLLAKRGVLPRAQFISDLR